MISSLQFASVRVFTLACLRSWSLFLLAPITIGTDTPTIMPVMTTATVISKKVKARRPLRTRLLSKDLNIN